VSTRQLRRGEKDPSLLDVLTAGTAELDLDDPAAQERGRADVRAYITARLAGVDPLMDPEAAAAYLAGPTSTTSSEPFLLARLVTDQLRASPADTSKPGWERQVSNSVEDAIDTDLARAPQTPPGPVTRSPGEAARALLAALTWGLGAGMPEEEWLACANATAGGGFGRDHLSWVLEELGRYVIQDGEAGTAVYRIAHQTLADHIRPPFTSSYQSPFDPAAQAVTEELLARYRELLAQGVPADAPGYLWRYAWRHATAAGPRGLELLRGLADDEPTLVADVAMAADNVSSQLSSWGYRQEALAPAEEAVQLYRELAAANPAYLPDRAGTLNNLGVRYGEVGRRNDALPPPKKPSSCTGSWPPPTPPTCPTSQAR
jgi:Tetratricopeptide repeat